MSGVFDDLLPEDKNNKPEGVSSGVFDDLKPEGKGFTGHAKDLSLSIAKGVIGVPEALVGLADIPTGGRVGKFLENEDGLVGFRPKQAKEYLSEFQTEQFKDQQRQFSEADGVLDKTKHALRNPSLIANTVAESGPSMLAGGAIGKGVGAAAKYGPSAVKKIASSPVLMAGAGEGAIMAGQQASEIRNETEDGLLTGKQSAISAATGVAGALFGVAGGRIAQKLGIGDVDTLIQRGISGEQIGAEIAQMPAKLIPRKVIEGAITEGFLEELPQSVSEQVLQNLALDKEWHEGIEDAAVMGTLAGMAMGAGAASFRGSQSSAITADPEPEQPDLGDENSNASFEMLALPAPQQFNDDTPETEALGLPAPIYDVDSKGNVITSKDYNDRLDRIRRGDSPDITPIPKRSEQMGINPDAGPLSAAAAQHVDTIDPVIDNSVDGQLLGPEARSARGFIGRDTTTTYDLDPYGNVTSANGKPVSVRPTSAKQLGFQPQEQRRAPVYEVDPKGNAKPTSGEAAASRRERIDLSNVRSKEQPARQQQRQEAQPQTAQEKTPEQKAESSWNSMNTFERNKASTDTLGHRGVLAKNTAGKTWVQLSAKDQKKLSAGMANDTGQRWDTPNQKISDRDKPVLQNRDRSSQASIEQMNAIAGKPDYYRMGFSRDFGNGAPVVEPGANIPEQQLGIQDVAVTSAGRQIPVQYAVVETDQLLSSNDVLGNTNQAYAAGAKGKSRAVAGNGRVAGITSAWGRGTAENYKQDMMADTAHGVSPEVIRGMKNPVLVRVMPQDQVTNNIGDESNVSGQSTLNSVEQAKTDMRRLDLAQLDLNDNNELTTDSILGFINSMPASEKNALLDGASPSKQAVDRLEAAVFHQAYGSEELTRLQAEAVRGEARNIVAALLRAAPAMAKLEGAGALDIRPLVAEAAEVAINARRSGTPLAQFIQQNDFGRNPEIMPILQMMADNLRSAQRMGEMLTNLAEMAHNESMKGAVDLLGAVEPVSTKQLMSAAFNQELNNDDDTGSTQDTGQQRGAELDDAGAARQERPEQPGAGAAETAQSEADTAEQGQPAAVETAAPEKWRSNYLQAAKIAREQGIDPKQHKKLADLVAAIDAAQNTDTAPTLELAQQTEESRAEAERIEKARLEDDKKAKAQEAKTERVAREKAADEQAIESSLDRFELGQSAEQQLSGQEDIFGGTQNDKLLSLSSSKSTPNQATTNATLLKSLSDNYPALVQPVTTMLQRGRKGLKGGLVIVNSNKGTDIARVYSEKTGTPFSQSVRLLSDGSEINGFYDTKSGITFLIGPNLDTKSAPAVLLHEVTHSQQRESIDKRSMQLIDGRSKEKSPSLKAFLNRVAQRMDDAGEAGNPVESTSYIVEQAMLEASSQGYSVVDSKLISALKSTLGKTVAGIVRDFVKIVRQFALRNNLPLRITVDDLVAYAMAGVQKSAKGKSTNVSSSDRMMSSASSNKLEFESTAKAYGGKAAHQKAEDAGLTKLNYNQWIQVRTPAFKEWFGDWENAENLANDRATARAAERQRVSGMASKSAKTDTRATGEAGRAWGLDQETGEPRLFFHGTKDSFTEFNLDHQNRKDHGWLGTGIYTGSERRIAESYARLKDGSGEPRVMAFFSNVKNPYIATREEKEVGRFMDRAFADSVTKKAKAAGYDGIVLPFSDGNVELVAFDKPQMKSATDNNGSFSNKENDIRFSRAQTKTPAFKEWFGNSQVVDANGEPMIVYRGMNADATAMQPNHKGIIWTTPSKDYASDPHYGGRESGAVYPMYVKSEKLFDYDNKSHRDALLTEGRSPLFRQAVTGNFRAIADEQVTAALKRLGFDGFKAVEPEGQQSIGVFDSTQLKSSIGNNGDFDGTSPDIRFSKSKDSDPQNLYVSHNLSADNLLYAAKLGGLAAPSLGIGNIDVGALSSFGEITLLAEPGLLESNKVRTFDADIYTPRHPQSEYQIDLKAYKALTDKVSSLPGELRFPSASEVAENGAKAFMYSDGAKMLYLEEQGKAPKAKPRKADAWIKKAAKMGLRRFQLAADPAFKKIAQAEVNRIYAALEEADSVVAERRARFYFDEGTKTISTDKLESMAREIQTYADSSGVDEAQLRKDIAAKLRTKKAEADFKTWAEAQLEKLATSKKIYAGLTPAGNRKYIDYNLANIVKQMTRELQGGEGFNYGAGSVRSKYANEMKSVEAVKSRRDQIVSAEEFAKLKDESSKKLEETLEALKPYYRYSAEGFGYYDDASSAIAEGASGIREAFDLDAEGQKIVGDLVSYLKNLPTEYFEAKASRAVDLSEFSYAIVPKGTPSDVTNLLREKGVKIKRYDAGNTASREQAIRDTSGILFSRRKKAHNPNQGDLFAELEALSNDDPYENTKQRPGTTEKQRELGRSALRDFFGWLKNSSRAGGNKAGAGSGEVSLLGASIYKDFQAGKPYQLVGQTIRDSHDLAAIAQIYRDPRFETFRAFYVDENGKIILEQTGSTRMPSSVTFTDSFMTDMKSTFDNVGAKKLYLMHNHPSGVPTPSQPDIVLTMRLGQTMGSDLAGHVVIDHNKYAVIDDTGNVTEHEDQSLAGIDFSSAPEMPHNLLEHQINDPASLALAAKQLAHSNSPVIVITKGGAISRVGLIASLPMDLLEKGKSNSSIQDPGFTAAIRRMIRAAGTGGRLFVVLPKGADTKNNSYQWMHSFAQDVSDSDGNSVINIKNMISIDDYASVSIKNGRQSDQKAKIREGVGAFDGNSPDIRFSKSQIKKAAFKKAFGKSKVVDNKGDPLLVYHGSGAKFATFDKEKRGATTRAKSAEKGFFFTSSKSLAYDFKKQAEGAAADLAAIRKAVKSLSDSQLENLASDISRIASEDLDLEGRDFFIDSLMNMYQYDTDINTWPEESNGTPKVLKNYISKDILEPGAIHDVYLRIENPHEYTFNEDDDSHDEGAITQAISDAHKNGNDGVILRNMVDVARADEKGNNAIRSDVYIAFEPDQIIQSEDSAGILFSRTANPASVGAAPNGMATWDSPSASKFDDFVYTLQDKHVDTKRVLEAIRETGKEITDDLDVYLQETLFHGRAAKRTQDFLNKEVNPLVEYMQSAKVTMPDLEEFLHARHAEEANALIAERDPNMADGGSGMTNAEARKYMSSLNGIDRKRFENAAKMVDKIIGSTRDTIVSYGLESQDTVDGWTNGFKHYIPLQREDKDGQMGIGQGFSVKGSETKGRTGSTRKVVDILANVMMQRERIIVRGEKNRVAAALLGLAKDNPMPEFWTVDKVPTHRVLDKKTGLVRNQVDPTYKNRANAVVAKVNGKEHAVLMNEDDARAMRMAEALKNLDAAQLEGLLGATATATRYFAAVNTQYNPIFGVTNMVRDIQEAMLHLQSTPLAGQQKRLFKNTFKAIAEVMRAERGGRKGRDAEGKWGKLWDEFQNVGGQTGFRDQFSNSADRGKEIQRALTPDGWAETGLGKFFTANGTLKAPLEVVRKKASWMFDLLSDYNTAMENGVRLSAYETGINSGMSKGQAASLAKSLTVNFNRKGAVTQQVGALYAFFNASVQGSARLGQSLLDMDPGKPKTMRLSKLGKRIVSGGVLLGSVQALMLAAMGFDDDEPPEFIRERNVIIPTGGKTYISIPMPLGYHVIANLGRIPTEFALGGGKDAAKHMISLLDVMSDVYNPLGSTGLSMQSIAPTVIDPLAALAENKDFSGRAIAKESFNRQTPGHALARDTASLPATWLAQVVNYATGGTEFTRGELSPTPDQIDYLVGQLTGGVGRETTKFMKSIQATATGDDLPWHNIPLAGRFFGDADSDGAKQSAFYNRMDKVRRHSEEVKGLRAAGRGDEAIEYSNKNPHARLHLAARAAEKQVKEMRDHIRGMEQAGAAREDIRAAEKRMVQRMEQFVELSTSRE